MTEYSFNGDNLLTVKRNIHIYFKYVGFTYYTFITLPLRAYYEFNPQSTSTASLNLRAPALQAGALTNWERHLMFT